LENQEDDDDSPSDCPAPSLPFLEDEEDDDDGPFDSAAPSLPPLADEEDDDDGSLLPVTQQLRLTTHGFSQSASSLLLRLFPGCW